jgi:hypothetical protein
MKRRHISFVANSIFYAFIGLYFDKVIAFFRVKSGIALAILCVSLFFSAIPFIFAVDVYEGRVRNETKMKKGFWLWKRDEISVTYETTTNSVVKLFGVVPITEPVVIERNVSSSYSLEDEIDYGEIRNAYDLIVSLIPLIGGWLAQPRNS